MTGDTQAVVEHDQSTANLDQGFQNEIQCKTAEIVDTLQHATSHTQGDIDCRPESQQNDVMRLWEVEVLCDDRTTEHDDCSDKQSHLPGTTEQLSVDGNLARQVRALSHQLRTHQLKGQRHRGKQH